MLLDGETEALGETLGLIELDGEDEGEVLLEGDTEGDTEALTLLDGLTLSDTLELGDGERDTEDDGETLADGDTEALGLREAEGDPSPTVNDLVLLQSPKVFVPLGSLPLTLQ